MRVAPSFIKTVIQPTQKSLNTFVRQLHTTYQNLSEAFNGRVSYGDGNNTENIDGSWVNLTTPAPAGTNFTVTHGLNRIPVGVHVTQKNAFVDILVVSSTKNTITLQASAAGVVVKLFIFLLFLCLLPLRSEAQGANHTNIALQTITASGSTGLSGPLLKPIAGAVITVCLGSVAPVGSICSPANALLYSNSTLSTTITNPTNADNNGNFTFWAAANTNFVVSVSGVGLTPYSYIWTSPSAPGLGAFDPTQNITFSGNDIYTKPLQFNSTSPPTCGSGTGDIFFSVSFGRLTECSPPTNLVPLAYSLNGCSSSLTVNDLMLAGDTISGLCDSGIAAANVVQKVANGTATMTTALIAAGACGTTVTVSAASVLTTDRIIWSFNAAVGSNPGVLTVQQWPTANNVNFEYCNPTAGGITPSAATINWSVVR